MVYSARLPAGLDAADLTHGEREFARWAALSFDRKCRIVLYLLCRLGRLARDEVHRAAHVAVWKAIVHARSCCGHLTAISVAMRKPDLAGLQRRAERALEICGAHGPRWAATAVVYILLLSLPTLFAMSVDRQLGSVREQAALARQVRPSPCIWVDGNVWIEAQGGYVRPRDLGYIEMRRGLCGY